MGFKKNETELNHKYKAKVAYFDENRNRCPPPERCERRTTFTVTYKKKGDATIYVRKTIADNEYTAKNNMKKNFFPENWNLIAPTENWKSSQPKHVQDERNNL